MALPLPQNLPNVRPQVIEALRKFAREYKPAV